MIDGADIIHMNGRIYDSHLARFVQADPIIQAPEVLGSLNRYSYVWNNPLNMTDPSGYMGCRVPPDMQRAMPIYDVYSESSSGYDVTLTYDDGSPQTFFLSDSFVDSATGEVDQGWADAVVDASGGRFGRNVTGYFNEQGEPLLASDNGPSGNLVEDPTLKSALEVVEGEVAHKDTPLLSRSERMEFIKSIGADGVDIQNSMALAADLLSSPEGIAILKNMFPEMASMPAPYMEAYIKVMGDSYVDSKSLMGLMGGDASVEAIKEYAPLNLKVYRAFKADNWLKRAGGLAGAAKGLSDGASTKNMTVLQFYGDQWLARDPF